MGPSRTRPRRPRLGRAARRPATGPTSSSTPRHGRTWTAAPAIRPWPCAATAPRPGRWPRLAPSTGRRWCRSPPTRSSTDCGPTACRTTRPIRPAPGQPLRRSEAGRRAMRPARPSEPPARTSRQRRMAPAGARKPAVPPLAIVRTAWLFGPPGSDFPHKIIAAARSAAAEDRTLAMVSDEIGTPTYAADLARAIAGLLEQAANRGIRRGSAASTTSSTAAAPRGPIGAARCCALPVSNVPTRDVPLSTWPRPSTPPPWGVMAATPLPAGPLRDWQAALADYLAAKRR